MWHAWKSRKVYKVLVGKLEVKRSLGRKWRRWDDAINMDFREFGGEGGEWLSVVTGGELL
jgi:hypothetical protein